MRLLVLRPGAGALCVIGRQPCCWGPPRTPSALMSAIPLTEFAACPALRCCRPAEFVATSNSAIAAAAAASQAAEELAALDVAESDVAEQAAAGSGGAAAAPAATAAGTGEGEGAAAGAAAGAGAGAPEQGDQASDSEDDLPPIPRFNNRKVIVYEVSDTDSDD